VSSSNPLVAEKGVAMNVVRFSKFCFDEEYDERAAFEARARGYLGGVWVELSDGRRHRVVFWDVVRLTQDLEVEAQSGRPFIAEQGMIVLTEVTLENMTAAVHVLIEDGFFE
jgi:hypothetical protein